jgi:hypothetical protein
LSLAPGLSSAQVLWVIDGNTFEARAPIRSGMDVSTRVALMRLLAEGS